MGEQFSSYELEIADDLFDLIANLWQQIRTDILREISSKEVTQEWQDVSELRATNGQLRLLRILAKYESRTMQELADQLGVAPPTVTVMIKRLLVQGFVERLRDEQDWRVVRVLPTERGQRALALYDQLRRKNLQRRLAHLSQEELATLRASLPILRHITEVEL